MLDNENFIRKLYTTQRARNKIRRNLLHVSDEGYMLDMASGTKFRGKAMVTPLPA